GIPNIGQVRVEAIESRQGGQLARHLRTTRLAIAERRGEPALSFAERGLPRSDAGEFAMSGGMALAGRISRMLLFAPVRTCLRFDLCGLCDLGFGRADGRAAGLPLGPGGLQFLFDVS